MNLCRSVTGEKIFKDRYKTKSAGISKDAQHEITQEDLDWADAIIVMETYMKRDIERWFDCKKPIYVLDIPDIYPPMNEELIIELEKRVPKNI